MRKVVYKMMRVFGGISERTSYKFRQFKITCNVVYRLATTCRIRQKGISNSKEFPTVRNEERVV